MSLEMKEVYIRFMAQVNPQTTNKLIKLIDDKLKAGYTKIHLLLSSPGGSVFHGISLYNFLKGIPIDVATYNFGSVDSIGVILFCAGKERYSVPNARFLIHGITLTVGNMVFDEKSLEETMKSMQIDKTNISNIIAATTNKKPNDIIDIMHERKTLNPNEAIDFGLATEIKTELLPKGAELHSIDEFETPMQMYNPTIIPQHPIPYNKIMTYTNYFDRGITTT